MTAIATLTAAGGIRQTEDGAVLANGTLSATITQPCAVTREDLAYDVEEPLALRFVPAGSLPEVPSTRPTRRSNSTARISTRSNMKATASTSARRSRRGRSLVAISLAIDPYREGPDADEARKKAGIVSDEDHAPSGPLAEALAGLKKDGQ